MRVILRTSSGKTGVRALAWVERLLVIAGVGALGWSGLVVVERHVAQYFAHEALVAMPRVESPALEPSTVRRPLPATGTPLANLEIPRIRLSAVVLQGSDAGTLRVGAGHIENTALPGEAGNVAIAGHRDSFFRPLRYVRLGDDIILETPQERLLYRVSSVRVVQPSEISVLNPTPEAALTLVTCYPFWVFGHAPDRFIVRATLVAGPAAGARPALASWPIANTPAPTVERAAAAAATNAPISSRQTSSIEPGSRGAADNVVLVRRTIERFRLTYNARYTSHGEVRPGGPLALQDCNVVIDHDNATATCRATPQPPDGSEVLAPSFMLRKTAGVWAIRSFSLLP